MTYCPVAIVASVPVAVRFCEYPLGPATLTSPLPPVGTLTTTMMSPTPVLVELELLHAAANRRPVAIRPDMKATRRGRKQTTCWGVTDGGSDGGSMDIGWLPQIFPVARPPTSGDTALPPAQAIGHRINERGLRAQDGADPDDLRLRHGPLPLFDRLAYPRHGLDPVAGVVPRGVQQVRI